MIVKHFIKFFNAVLTQMKLHAEWRVLFFYGKAGNLSTATIVAKRFFFQFPQQHMLSSYADKAAINL
jgi:hypothetical protein